MGIKYSVDESFFDVGTKRMAYILGYIYADGHIGDYSSFRGRYIGITSTDLESIIRIRRWLSSKHKICRRKPSWTNGKDTFSIRIGSKRIYESLTRFGLHPHKSLTIQLPKIPFRYVRHFVLGYFDGDGCVSIYKIVRGNKTLYRKLSVIFTSGSKLFLEQLERVLRRDFETKFQHVLKTSTAFQLRYSTKDSLLLFDELYKGGEKGDYLERKHRIFVEWTDIRNGHVAKKSTRRSAKPLCVGANPTMASD